MPSQQLLAGCRLELRATPRHMPPTSPPTLPPGRHFPLACLPPNTHGQNDLKIRAGHHYKGGVQSRRGGKPYPAGPTNSSSSGSSGGGRRIDFTQVFTKSALHAAPPPRFAAAPMATQRRGSKHATPLATWVRSRSGLQGRQQGAALKTSHLGAAHVESSPSRRQAPTTASQPPCCAPLSTTFEKATPHK